MGTLQMETSGMDTVEETSPGFSKFSICMHVWWDLGVGSNFIGSISYQNQPVKKKILLQKTSSSSSQRAVFTEVDYWAPTKCLESAWKTEVWQENIVFYINSQTTPPLNSVKIYFAHENLYIWWLLIFFFSLDKLL